MANTNKFDSENAPLSAFPGTDDPQQFHVPFIRDNKRSRTPVKPYYAHHHYYNKQGQQYHDRIFIGFRKKENINAEITPYIPLGNGIWDQIRAKETEKYKSAGKIYNILLERIEQSMKDFFGKPFKRKN